MSNTRDTPSSARVPVVASAAHRAHHPAVEVAMGSTIATYELPERAEEIRRALESDDRFTLVAPISHDDTDLAAVHDPAMVRFLRDAWERTRPFSATDEVFPDVFASSALRRGMGPGHDGPPAHPVGELGYWCFETATPLVQGTYGAARAAVDIAISAAERVIAGERVAYGLCRPPGHHAAYAAFGGYCYFNNAAVAAHRIAREAGSKVAVLDVDYHHGNGTQQIFYERVDVLFASLHADPARAYPYLTGDADETGHGPGRGANLNIPLPPGTADDAYLDALARALDTIAAFGPAALVVSLGLDTFWNDPICDLAVTADGFERCGAAVGAVGLPTVVVQEGGYDIDAIGDNTRRWLGGLIEAGRPEQGDD